MSLHNSTEANHSNVRSWWCADGDNREARHVALIENETSKLVKRSLNSLSHYDANCH